MRDNITFAVLFPVGLPVDARPQWVWYAALICGIAALGIALRQRTQLRRRLSALSAFLSVTPDQAPLPALPVRENDVLGTIEYQLSRLLTTQGRHVQQLQDEKKELEALLHSMAEGIVVLDPQGNIVRWNPAALHLFGLDPTEDWQGRPFQEFFPPPCSASAFVRRIG